MTSCLGAGVAPEDGKQFMFNHLTDRLSMTQSGLFAFVFFSSKEKEKDTL